MAAAAAVTGGRLVVGLVLALVAVRARSLGAAPGVANPHSLAGAFLHWDATWYRDVAVSGYAHVATRTAFYPVYPLLVHALTVPGAPYPVAALAVSWAGFFLAGWSVAELSRLLFPEARAGRAVVLFAWFPMSTFLLSGYAEPVFDALLGWSLVFVARRRYAGAVALAAVASATRPEGFLVGSAAAVALVLGRRYGRAALAAVGSLSGLGAYSVFCWVRFGSPVEYVHAQAFWHRETGLPFVAILRNLQRLLSGARSGSAGYPFEMVVEDVLLVLVAIGVVWLVRSARDRSDLLPFLPLTVLTVLVASSNTTWGIYPDGAGRMMLGLIPLYPLATRLHGRWWRVLVTASCLVAVFLQVLFNSALAVI